jgi:glycosyltransferase involved in cell wall biosynthesis
LACGTPVVATDIWGVPEVISTGAVGILTRRTERAIAEGISVALRKIWLSDDLLRHANQYSWVRSASAVRHVFENALHAKEKLLYRDVQDCQKATAQVDTK